MNNLLGKLLSLVLTRAVADSERMQTAIAGGLTSVLLLVGLPDSVAKWAAAAVASLTVVLVKLYTDRRPGMELPPPPSSADGVPK